MEGVVTAYSAKGAGSYTKTSYVAEEELHVSMEEAHVINEPSIMGGFQLINEEPLDSLVFSESSKMWRGESSTKYESTIQI